MELALVECCEVALPRFRAAGFGTVLSVEAMDLAGPVRSGRLSRIDAN